MRCKAAVGGRIKKGDKRSLRNWCGRITLTASLEGDQYLLAALYRAMYGDASDEFYEAWKAEAQRCCDKHESSQPAAPAAEQEETL